MELRIKAFIELSVAHRMDAFEDQLSQFKATSQHNDAIIETLLSNQLVLQANLEATQHKLDAVLRKR